MRRYTENVDLAALQQRLFRVLWSALALENSTIKILERTSLFRERPDPADIADVTDRIHECFNAFQQCTKVKLWHDFDDDQLDEE